MPAASERIVHDPYELAALQGEWPAVALDRRPRPTPKPVGRQLTEAVPRLDADAMRAIRGVLLEQLQFHERYSDSVIEHDLIGLLRHLPDGTVERYSEKLGREAAKGAAESAAFGLGRLGAHQVVVYAMDWDFFAGSFGTVSGEKFQMAVDLALRKKVPLVGIYSSSGVRQHENFAGLVQMSRAVHALGEWQRASRVPHLAVLVGQVWGGIAASIVPLADVLVAIAGTEYGFSGPNVIEAYEGRRVEPGTQRVEEHLLGRCVDVVVPDADAALAHLTHVLDVGWGDGGAPAAEVADIADTTDLAGVRIVNGVLATTRERQALPPVALPDPDARPVEPTPTELHRRYQALVRSGTHPDPAFFTATVFDRAVSLNSSVVADRRLHHPAITASLARLDDQAFLVIASQPSYQESWDGVRRIPASPGPADYEYLERVLDAGERWRLPVVFFADTLGAKPTLEAERQNQMLRIARAISRGLTYQGSVLTVVTGALGSGGGLTVAPGGDYIAMLDDALAFVAEARSAASILYKTAQPTEEQVVATLATMRASAADQLDLRLIDEVIPTGRDPLHTAAHIRHSLQAAYERVRGMSREQLLSRRRRRLRRPGGLTVRHGRA